MRVLYHMPLQVNLCCKKHETRKETYRLEWWGKGITQLPGKPP